MVHTLYGGMVQIKRESDFVVFRRSENWKADDIQGMENNCIKKKKKARVNVG